MADQRLADLLSMYFGIPPGPFMEGQRPFTPQTQQEPSLQPLGESTEFRHAGIMPSKSSFVAGQDRFGSSVSARSPRQPTTTEWLAGLVPSGPQQGSGETMLPGMGFLRQIPSMLGDLSGFGNSGPNMQDIQNQLSGSQPGALTSALAEIYSSLFPTKQPGQPGQRADDSFRFYNDPGVRQGTGAQGAGGGSGGGMSYRGIPLPQAPSLQAPQVDIGRMFDPIMEQLKDPKRVEGPSKMEGLAQVLGGAAKGAMAGLSPRFGGGVGATLAGAGAGSADAMAQLRHEEQALEVEHQRAVKQMDIARAGVLSNKAGAEINLARAVADTKNAEAQLQFNRDVQASQMSRQQVTPFGNGIVRIEQFNPNTGAANVREVDTVGPQQRAMQQAYMMSQTEKNMRGDTRKEGKILIDGKEYSKSSLIGAGQENFRTDLQKEAYDTMLRAADMPQLLASYGARLENDISNGVYGKDTIYMKQRYTTEPTAMILDFIYHESMTNPAERIRIRNFVMTGKVIQ